MWKWDRSMLPAGKLPLRFLFLIGFGIGLSAAYFGRRIWFQTTGILDEDMLYRMKYMTVDSRGLFLYVLCKRCRNFIVLIIMATTYLGLVFCGGDYGKVRIFHRFFYKYGYLPVWDQRALIGNCRCISTVSVLCAGDISVDQMV